jgi:hypothetical protein
MATTSTVPAARQALYTALVAALPSVQVSYSHPGEAVERDTVYLGDARGRHDPATIKAGRRTRDEQYTLDVWVESTADGPDAREAFERCFVLKAEVEDVLADDASLGLGQPFWMLVGDFEAVTGWDEDRRGHAARVRIGIEVRARLT